ncbi:hypothetical protein DAEQUDRAFT_800096 [Daedalea quercina L-15889]|uniref:DUF6533 domain-containing protein n=1 Tax=Daedalea quercina L-15889 TaxID=1314783 RepID=A0A165T9Q3_9APHY|nr:hypothetical protein DAEQUDRAFT_800096 [Daedalea quercina L-15889]
MSSNMPLLILPGYTRSYVEVKLQLAKPSAIFVQIYLDLENYLFFSATAIVFHDYFLTLDREVSYIWTVKQSFVTMLFYGFRYAALLNIIPMLLIRMSLLSLQSNWSCGVVLHVQMALDTIILVSGTIFAALRVYAIFNRSRSLFCLVLVTGLLNPAISIYIFKRFLTTLDAYLKVGACMLPIIGDDASYENWVIGARAASVISDGIVLFLTVVKTFSKKAHQAQHGDNLTSTLGEILLRDSRLTEFEIWQTWTAAFTSILLSRLALDLREVSDAHNEKSEFYSRTLRSVSFRVGSSESNLSMVSPETDEDTMALASIAV